MKAWFIPVDGDTQEIEVKRNDRTLIDVGKQYIGSWCDMPKVKYNGKVCHMAVDDEGLLKGLPINRVATEAYRAACRPGTTAYIAGPAVIFDGLLP